MIVASCQNLIYFAYFEMSFISFLNWLLAPVSSKNQSYKTIKLFVTFSFD